MILAITGTPGSGKTYIANRLVKASKSRLKCFDLNKYIKDNKMYISYDRKAKTHDVDIKVLKKKITTLLRKYHSTDNVMDKIVGKSMNLKELIDVLSKNNNKDTKGIILDSHLSHYLDNDYCIVVRTDIKNLHKRLKARDYPKKKIEENIQSEIFEICLDEAKKMNRRIILVNN
jgi:adenylate kinase